ncbi:alpha/beta hydrolase [Dactylosporangium sp. NPDC005555]|uniref:alpha/beta hydrolase n=1 Tax=Dactylosporangium sp. NPDC005555 TaxID=3154889 RepID=UPI0033B44822
MTPTAIPFTHTSTDPRTSGVLTVTGRRNTPQTPAAAARVPLIIAIHGGTYTSGYFDIEGYSLLERAAALGVPVIALDRPGYAGSTPVEPGESIILANAEALTHVIGELWQQHGDGHAGVFVIGHSIGGAVTTAIAAGQPTWPLLGIAVSGCLLQVPDGPRMAFDALPDILMIDLPGPMKDSVMFGPAWTHATTMPELSHSCDTSVPRAELIDINNGWISRVRSVNAQVTVPVHARQGEFDALWITDAGQAADYAASFTSAPVVDGRLVLNAGHCVDFHHAGAALQLSQLAFALECSVAKQDAT